MTIHRRRRPARHGRREFLGLLSGAAGAAGATRAAGRQDDGDDWPSFGFDARNTGHDPGGSRVDGNVSEAWFFEAPDPTGRIAVQSAGGRGDPPVGDAGTDTRLAGVERSALQVDRRVLSAPAVAGETAFVRALNDDVYALDAATGDRKWVHRTEYELDATRPEGPTLAAFGGGGDRDDQVRSLVASTPAVADGVVYAGSLDGTLYALDAATGDVVWERDLGSAVGAPTVVGDAVVVGTLDGTVGLLSVGGELRWRYDAGSRVEAPPAVRPTDGTVYAATDEDVHAVRGGDRRWRVDAEGRPGPPVLDAGTLFVGDGTTHGGNRLWALDAADGTEKWRYETAESGPPTPPTVAVADRPYALTHDQRLHALDGEGNRRWRYRVVEPGAGLVGRRRQATPERSRYVSPAVVDDVVYVPGSDDTVHAVDADGGDRLWRAETGGTGPIAVAGGRVFVQDESGDAYALAGSGADGAAGSGSAPSGTTSNGVPLTLVGGGAATLLVALGGAALWRSRRGTDAGDSPERDGPTPDPEGPPGTGREGTSATTQGNSGTGDRGSDATGDAGPEPAAVDGTDRRTAGERTDRRPDDGEADGAPGDREGPPSTIPGAPDLSLSYDDFERREVIGRGGNADVYLATVGGDRIAVKEPRFQGTMHADAVDRILDEAETWAGLDDGDHVVGVVDYGESPVPWIAMEYMDRGPLGGVAGDLSVRRALWTALGVTRGVRHAHRRGVAHLDLRPGNVLLRSTDGWPVPKVADWGLARTLIEDSGTVEGYSPQYAAPEQVDEKRGPADQVTDVYGLGAVLYELFTGRPPFSGHAGSVVRQVLEEDPTPPTEVDPSLPAELDDLLSTALAKDRDDRFEDVLYVRDRLEDLYDQQ